MPVIYIGGIRTANHENSLRPPQGLNSPQQNRKEAALSALSPARSSINAAAVAAQNVIEVEKKFQVPMDIRERVLRCGGFERKTLVFRDTYWDYNAASIHPSPPFLTSRDCWLRYREAEDGSGEGQWELKVPIPGATTRTGGELNTFREIVGARAVAAELMDLIAIDWTSYEPYADLAPGLRAAGLEPFGSFSTKRTKLAIPVLDLAPKRVEASIDVDQAGFGQSGNGYAVMEIELMCATADEVPAMEEAIDDIAKQLDVMPLTDPQGGKLETFIREYCPEVFARLVECGVLRNSQVPHGR